MHHIVSVHYKDGHYSVAYSGHDLDAAIDQYRALAMWADVYDVTLTSEE